MADDSKALVVRIKDDVPVETMVARYSDGTQVKDDKGLAVQGLSAFVALMEQRSRTIADLAANRVDAKRVRKIMLYNFQKNQKLLKCTGMSIMQCIIQAVELGFEPGGPLKHAHLVPFGAECQLVIGFQGFADLAYRSGRVASINAEAVYEGDIYEEEGGLEPKLRHVKMDGPRDPKRLTRVYCVVKLKDGASVYQSMTRAEVDVIYHRTPAYRNQEKYGKKKDTPWDTDYGEMAKKTVLKRTMKLVPQSVELAQALDFDNAMERGERGVLDSDLDGMSAADRVNVALGGTLPPALEAIEGTAVDVTPPDVEERPSTAEILRRHAVDAKQSAAAGPGWQHTTDDELKDLFPDEPEKPA